jgi:hypothetical protein
MKLFEHPETEKTLDRLPGLPPGVEVPDDISGIEPPTTLKPTAGGIRWMRWLAAIVLLGAAGVVTAVLVRSDDATETPDDYMEAYGTDNPTFVPEAAGPGTVDIVATVDYMELYGTDNPVFVPEAAVADNVNAGDYMRLYGTDNPVFVPEAAGPGTVDIVGAVPPSSMELYGTDNPVFVPGASVADNVNAGDYMRLYGTDNPAFVPDPSYMELYGTDNPVVEP